MLTQSNTTTIWNRFFVQLLIVEAMLQIGGFISRPVVTSFAVETGATLSAAGFIAGLGNIGAMILRPVSGFLSDSMSKKRLLVISAFLFALSSFGVAISDTPIAIGAWNALQGVALAFKSVCMASLVAMASPPERIGSSIGLLGLMNTLAMAIAPAAGSAISEAFGYSICFFVSAGICAAGFLLALAYRPAPVSLPTSDKSKTGASEAGGNALSRLFKSAFYVPTIPYTVIILFTMWSHGTLTTMVLVLSDMGYLESGAIYFTAFAICALVSRPFAGRLSDTAGVAAVAIPGLGIAALGLGLLAVYHSLPFVIIAGIGMGIGQSGARSALEAESVRGVDVGHLGRASNTFYTGMDLGVAAGPIVSGLLLQVSSAQMLFVSLAASCVIAAIILLFVNRAHRRKKQRRTS